MVDSAPRFVAVFGSLLLHALVVVLMLGKWQKTSPGESTPELHIVKARLVELKEKAPGARPETEVIDLTARRERERKAEEARKLAQRKRNEEEKRREKAREVREKQAEIERQKELERQERAAALEGKRLSDFERALLAEEGYQAELQERQVVASAGYEIERAVESNWSRPPSARRGMQAVLRVSLVPTGGLSAVAILESSGDSAFDRSATQAVQKAAPFAVVKELAPVIFEKNFRTFQFRFSPQDLRL